MRATSLAKGGKKESLKQQIFRTIQIGMRHDIISRVFDYFIVAVIAINLFITLFSTFEAYKEYQSVLDCVELITIVIFTVEYLLRVWTADLLYPELGAWHARVKYFFSFYGIIDLLTFFPYYIPYVFPAGAVAFRMFRVIRIFRLFKINAQYDAFHVITDVLYDKKDQLLSSICMIVILILAASLCMYNLEHNAQPESFSNAFSGIWWATSTLLTVGYGDIYPVTIAGKIMGILITFLGVGMVAVPTGIISAGFVERYTKLKNSYLNAEENPRRFVAVTVHERHAWNRKKTNDLVLPPQTFLAMILRNQQELWPKSDTLIETGDVLVLMSKHSEMRDGISFKEIIVKSGSVWLGRRVDELDLPSHERVLWIERNGKQIMPKNDHIIKYGDIVVVYRRE